MRILYILAFELDCKRCCPFPQTQPSAQTRYLFNGDVDGRPDAHHLHLLLPHHLEDDLHPGLLHRSHHPHIPAAEAQFKGLQTSADIPRRLQTPSNAKRLCQCTMCTLFNTNSAGLLKLGHILKNHKKYFYEHIFFPALTTRRKMGSFKFLWFSNSKIEIFSQKQLSIKYMSDPIAQ